MTDTKGRILDTAERLFAEHGYGATSLRSIIAEAKVNLAAVHYHFRTKEALLAAVLMRRLEPVNRERLARLDEYERAAGDQAPSIENVLTALIETPLRLSRDPAYAGFVKLMGRVLGDGDAALIRKNFGEVIERFMAALQRALPELPSEELRWRVLFMGGAVAHTLLGVGIVMGLPGTPTTERLVTFLAAGFRAPVTAEVGGAA
jgi:AcrR family transcriptional regulator